MDKRVWDGGRPMNTAKWDKLARDYRDGTQTPANGWEAWYEAAREEALLIRIILPEVEVLVEVGCGIGRLTARLSELFTRVVATDTSSECRSVTRASVEGSCPNAEVSESLTPDGDAAVVWGEMYDSDWSLGAVCVHVDCFRAIYPLLLIQTTRADVQAEYAHQASWYGADWLLLDTL